MFFPTNFTFIHNLVMKSLPSKCNIVLSFSFNLNFTLLEYTPLHENYNVRVYIDDKLNILEYYFDITDGNEIEDGIPYYDDLYLDVVFYQECATKSSTYINLEDRNDLSDALKNGAINKEKYDFAFKIADSVMKELKNKTNRFVNRGIEDYLKYRKNII